jgi:hypothetical protein
MTKTIVSQREFEGIMFDAVLYSLRNIKLAEGCVDLSGCFDVEVLRRGDAVKMRNILDKCYEKKEIREFIKYYRLLRKAREVEAEVEEAEVEEAESEEAEVEEAEVEAESEDSSSDYVPEDDDEDDEDDEEEDEEDEEEDEDEDDEDEEGEYADENTDEYDEEEEEEEEEEEDEEKLRQKALIKAKIARELKKIEISEPELEEKRYKKLQTARYRKMRLEEKKKW